MEYNGMDGMRWDGIEWNMIELNRILNLCDFVCLQVKLTV